MNFEYLLEKYQPMIHKFSRRSLPGYDIEDLRQEAMLVLTKCYQNFDKDQAQFITFYWRSLDNHFQKLREKAYKLSYAANLLECENCKNSIPISKSYRNVCSQCGGKKWYTVHAIQVTNVDLEFNLHGYSSVEDSVQFVQDMGELVGKFPVTLRKAVKQAITGEKELSSSEKVILKKIIKRERKMSNVRLVREG